MVVREEGLDCLDHLPGQKAPSGYHTLGMGMRDVAQELLPLGHTAHHLGFFVSLLWPASLASRAKNDKWAMVTQKGLYLGVRQQALYGIVILLT